MQRSKDSLKIKLVYDDDDEIPGPVDATIKRRWNRLALLQLLPIITGIIFSEFLPPIFFHHDYLFAGVAISLVIIFSSKSQNLHPPFSL